MDHRGVLALVIVEAEPYGQLLDHQLVWAMNRMAGEARVAEAQARLRRCWVPASAVTISWRWL